MSDSQDFIGRNRAPRVQIAYDLERGDAKEKVELPFVMGVMSDLAGKSESAEAKKPVDKRQFLEIDMDNFDSRMEALAPRVTFQVANTLTKEGNLPVDLTFKCMEDFSPVAVVKQVDVLNKIFEARTQLAALLTYLDGRSDAEELLATVMKDPNILKTIALVPDASKILPKGAE